MQQNIPRRIRYLFCDKSSTDFDLAVGLLLGVLVASLISGSERLLGEWIRKLGSKEGSRTEERLDKEKLAPA